MNVAIATHDLYPDPESGGTGRYVYETGRRLVDRGHEVAVLTRRRGDVPRHETVEGMDVHRFDLEVVGRSGPAVLADVPAALRTVAGYAGDLHPDIVSFQGPIASLLLDRVVDDDVPRSCTFHSPWPAEYRIETRDERTTWRRRLNATVREYLEGRVVDRADEVIVLSAYMGERLREHYDPAVETAVVPGGVDPARFSPDAGVYEPMADDDLSFLTVRRLSPRMGHGLLLDAFARVRSTQPSVELSIAGDGSMRKELEERAADLGVADAVTFLGYVPDEDLPAAYATADVFVLPTLALEGFGLATLEALAAGTPAVGTPVGGTVELLSAFEARSGISEPMLAAGADADALAERMDSWAALDSAERALAGRDCRRYAREHYPWAATVDALEERYRALVGRKRSGSAAIGTTPRSW